MITLDSGLFSDFSLNFDTLVFSYFLNQIKPEGNIVYEYNPLHNYRVTRDTDKNGKVSGQEGFDSDNVIIEGGSILDLDTELLNFDLKYPVDILPQASYDGSVNLILNDNKNIPRLINTRFSVLQNNTYEIVDRIGNNDTNLYDDSQFDLDTSLYKRVNTIPSLTFNEVLPHGNLKVGNYVIYIKYADADDNETDFVAESGIISCFQGIDCDPHSINGGVRDMTSNKSINLLVSDIDDSYDYIKVYYTRSTSDIDGNELTTAIKIEKKYPVRNRLCNLIITGDEVSKEIPLAEINMQYLIADKARTQTACQNMLFLGNYNKPDMLYSDLSDVSLRILPYLEESDSRDLIGETNHNYGDVSSAFTPFEYYNTKNIYYHLGYWDEEIYRLGIVYIMFDGSLSPVFNIRGIDGIPTVDTLFDRYSNSMFGLFDSSSGERQYLKIDETTYELEDSRYIENSKGVIRIDSNSTYNSYSVYGLGMFIPIEVVSYLKSKVRGFFIVRQKRIPTILAQAYILPMDQTAQVPAINVLEASNTPQYKVVSERFLNDDRILGTNYLDRLYYLENYNENTSSVRAGICPEYSLRQPYFNSLFTGTTYPVKEGRTIPVSAGLTRNDFEPRSYYVDTYIKNRSIKETDVKIVGLSDNTPIVSIEDYSFRARAGEAEEAFRFRYLELENKSSDASNLVRGSYSPYIGIVGNVDVGKIVNIYISGYNIGNMTNYFNVRYEDMSPYYAISDRISFEKVSEQWSIIQQSDVNAYITTCYRGDCYICNYTHRLNRNFQDPDAPINDDIVDENTWKENYDIENKEKLEKINRGDVNAVKIGSWITFKLRSSINLSLRSFDTSYPEEEGLTGLKRGFYPLLEMSTNGNYKIPESALINSGLSSTTSDKSFYTLPDVPYIKNRFDTRIAYSDLSISDAFKNGFRVFQFTHYRDYPRIYGGIIKMVELFGNILCIFEHGVALIPVNERAVAGEGSGGNVYINTSNVLPENPKMLSDTYGTQWPESVIKTPYYVYGVDTVGKKIWRTNGTQFEIISDFRIQQFLNRNISLSERELTPIIGIRNVKSHYNAFKQDVMFTFYDNLYGFEEKVWNICYNEVLQKWITFFSWIPSYSENIDNIYFSFDRNTSKWISKLAVSNIKSNNADGIVLSTVEFSEDVREATLNLINRPIPNTKNTGIENMIRYRYSLDKDNYKNYEKFRVIEENGVWKLKYTGTYNELISKEVWLLNIRVEILFDDYSGTDTDIKQYINGWKEYSTVNYGYYQSVVAITSDKVLNNQMLTEEDKNLPNLTTDFWKHGQSGIIDIKDKIKPTYWYGKQHPFEFEFVVVDNPSVHKIFNNLQLISNKAVPESFHYEIVGEAYDFHDDKLNMYYRQEATKELYQNLGSDILYDSNYTDIQGQLSHPKIGNTDVYAKSTLLPSYYTRVDTFNEVEDFYHKKNAIEGATYTGLSGTEVVREELLNEYKLWTHSEALDIKEVGRMRGNMNYQEDKWDVQIAPIIFIQKNEDAWPTSDESSPGLPPLVLNHFPEDITKDEVTEGDLPKDYKNYEVPMYDAVDVSLLEGSEMEGTQDEIDWNKQTSKWTNRKEVRPRDKYIKIRVRYSGKDLAIITALKTLYTISYA
jgi:hypothetical protein